MPNEIPDFQKEVRSLKAMTATNEQEFEKAENKDLSVSDELAAKEAAESFRESLVQAVISLSHKIQDFKESKPGGAPHSQNVLLKIENMEMDLKEIMHVLRPEMDKELAPHEAALTKIKDKENNIGDIMDLIENEDPRISKPALEKALKIAGDPKTDNWTLEKFAKTDNNDILVKVCSNPSAAPDLLESISEKQNVNFDVKATLVTNPKTPTDTITILLKDASIQASLTIKALASLQVGKLDLPITVQVELVRKSFANFIKGSHNGVDLRTLVIQNLLNLAKNPKTSSDDLDKMANSYNEHVLMSIASNPNTATKTLIKLLNPESVDEATYLIVRKQMLTPERVKTVDSNLLNDIGQVDKEILREYMDLKPKLFDRGTINGLLEFELPYEVLAKMLSNFDMEASTMIEISRMKFSGSKNLREMADAKMLKIATNPKSPLGDLIDLIRYENKEIARQARHILVTMAESSKTAPDTLGLLSKVSDRDVKLAVANNKSTPGETIVTLCKNKDPEIKAAAEKNRDYRLTNGNKDV